MRGATASIYGDAASCMFQSTRPMRGATQEYSPCCHQPIVSIHAPHAGRDLAYGSKQYGFREFQSTRPMRGATSFPSSYCWIVMCFNPRAPCGARPVSIMSFLLIKRFNPRAPCGARRIKRDPLYSPEMFQSTRPMRGATCRFAASTSITVFQSTRPMRGATNLAGRDKLTFAVSIHAPHAGRDAHLQRVVNSEYVSIHAPHAGRDDETDYIDAEAVVSIHAPHAGRDRLCLARLLEPELFQSTRPMRGATLRFTMLRRWSLCFNPRAPCGARHMMAKWRTAFKMFQSTRPMRGATEAWDRNRVGQRVSIHAPHAGRDSRPLSTARTSGCFNPRAPCGARPVLYRRIGRQREFQSTRPMRGATHILGIRGRNLCVSIHAPHAGRDTGCPVPADAIDGFNPRAPCGARLIANKACGAYGLFQSTRPMRGATCRRCSALLWCGVSIHAPHAGRD